MPTYKPVTLVMSSAPAYGYTSVKQNDADGVELILTLKNIDNTDYILSGTSTLFFKLANENGVVKVTLSELDEEATITRVNGKVHVLLTAGMVAETGYMAYELQEVEGTSFVSSQVAYLRVWPTTSDGEIIDSPEYRSLVSIYLGMGEAIEKAELAKSIADGTIEEENTRQTNETVRQTNELARIDAENLRKAAENLRGIEIEDARIDGINAKTYDTLKLRLDAMTLEQKNSVTLPHYDDNLGEYVGIAQFWNNLRNGKIYTTEFYQYDISPSSDGTKKDDNAEMVCEPSTNTVKGRNDYENIGLFMSLDVNAYVDENDNYHITAIKGDGRFKKDGTNGDVYVMAMPGYIKRYSDDNVWGISYADTMYPGFELLDEAVKIDGTVRPCLLHAKYVASRNPHENNNLASISGVAAEYSGMSHNGQIEKFKQKGAQYSGKTSHDDFYVQLMMWIKYATLNSDNVMKGCQSYFYQYENKVVETGVNRVIITNAEASNLLVGSTVSIGDYGAGSISTDRTSAQNYNLAERVNITDIVDLGDGNSAVYVDSANFDTTLTTTMTTYPWNAGGCDSVLGQDGSPYSNTSGKEPFIINGIEMIVGGYEILQNLIIYNNNIDTNDYKIQVYVCYDCTKYNTGSVTDDYDLIGYELAQTDNSWKYISKIGIDPNHPTVMVPIEAEASSTTGFGDGLYSNAPTTAFRVWLSLGLLYYGARVGLRFLYATFSLSTASWAFLGRLSATGRSRRRAGVN